MIYETVKETLGQIKGVIGQMENEDYAKLLPILSYNSIGKHTRHILEFYECLLNAQNGVVDYDARQRNILLETDVVSAKQSIEKICDILPLKDLKTPILLQSHFHETVLTPSSWEREIVYNIEHTIHHLAIIKIALKEVFPSVHIPENFGIAYSTLQYQNVK